MVIVDEWMKQLPPEVRVTVVPVGPDVGDKVIWQASVNVPLWLTFEVYPVAV
jgi:hypothetical protein